jgi:hypothetical protein
MLVNAYPNGVIRCKGPTRRKARVHRHGAAVYINFTQYTRQRVVQIAGYLLSTRSMAWY